MKETVRHYFGGGAAALNMHERLSDVLMWAVTATMEDAGGTPILGCRIDPFPEYDDDEVACMS